MYFFYFPAARYWLPFWPLVFPTFSLSLLLVRVSFLSASLSFSCCTFLSFLFFLSRFLLALSSLGGEGGDGVFCEDKPLQQRCEETVLQFSHCVSCFSCRVSEKGVVESCGLAGLHASISIYYRWRFFLQVFSFVDDVSNRLSFLSVFWTNIFSGVLHYFVQASALRRIAWTAGIQVVGSFEVCVTPSEMLEEASHSWTGFSVVG